VASSFSGVVVVGGCMCVSIRQFLVACRLQCVALFSCAYQWPCKAANPAMVVANSEC
jgi:hypothetical protein